MPRNEKDDGLKRTLTPTAVNYDAAALCLLKRRGVGDAVLNAGEAGRDWIRVDIDFWRNRGETTL